MMLWMDTISAINTYKKGGKGLISVFSPQRFLFITFANDINTISNKCLRLMYQENCWIQHFSQSFILLYG